LAFLFLVALLVGSSPGQPQDGCVTWQDCRDQALAAAAREDFELFHDLAWRAFQQGPKNDAALMTMLARAQSMSGRPHDALVMLQRLAALGVVTDAAESEDFRRVRALPGWSDLQARLAGAPTAVSTADPRVAPSAAPRGAAAPATSESPPASAAAAAKAAPADAAAGEATDALRFTTDSFVPAGLAYDAVSNRFIVADRRERKLSVVGERSQRMSNLIGAESGGFGDIGGIAIDRREGDLWVASSAEAGAKLHKLQLISGRVLSSAGLGDGVAPAAFGDLALTPSSDVLALDVLGRRIFRLKHQGSAKRQAEVVMPIEAASPASIAPASDTVVYIAHRDGISRADLSNQHVRAIKAPAGVDLTGLAWIRWHRGDLLGAQRSAGDTYQIVRIRLDRGGGTATRLDLLERRVPLPSPASVVLAADALYYLTVTLGSPDAAQFVVRRIQLK
jgi:hypothetical protein